MRNSIRHSYDSEKVTFGELLLKGRRNEDEEMLAKVTSISRINPVTGVPHTSEAKKQATRELLAGRGQEPTQPEEDKSSSDEVEELLAKVPRCTSKNLVAKKKTTDSVSKGRKKVECLLLLEQARRYWSLQVKRFHLGQIQEGNMPGGANS